MLKNFLYALLSLTVVPYILNAQPLSKIAPKGSLGVFGWLLLPI